MLAAMKRLEVEVWSDIACPWCYVGKRRLERAINQLQRADSIAVHWRAFELDPSAPAHFPASPSYVQRLANKYSLTESAAAEMVERMQRVGQAEGIPFDYAKIQGGNTFDAHRLLCFAATQGLQNALKERLLAAYFTEGRSVSDRAELVSLAEQVGLDVDASSAVLASDAFAGEARAEEQAAQELGIRGVPFFIIGRFGVSGAQPAETLREVLERALDELPETGQEPAPTEHDDALVCTPESCE